MARIRIAERYDKLLQNYVKTIAVAPDNTCVYAQYTIEVSDRSAIQAALKADGIPTAVHYPLLIHQQPAFVGHFQRNAHFPVAERAAARVMSLPMHPYLTEAEQDQIVLQLKTAVLQTQNMEI